MSREHRVQFLEFTFDLETGELSSDGGKVRLQPQPAATLRLLVENAGQLVSREVLKKSIWPDTVVEADQGLNFCIRQVRAALGDEAEGGRFIETLPRRGYRFIPSVRAYSDDAHSANARNVSAPFREMNDKRSPTVAKNSTRTKWIFGGALIALSVLAFAFFNRPQFTSNVIAVALLPLASAPDDSWASELDRQVTDALVTSLTELSSPKFGVRGPASTAIFAASTRPHTEIGSSLEVQYVLSGGVRVSDSTLFVQSVRVSDGHHVFAWRQPVRGRPASELASVITTAFGASLDRKTP